MLTRDLLKAFVPLGVLLGKREWIAVGAGVLFVSDNILWMVTAHHVIENAPGRRVAPIVTNTDGRAIIIEIEDLQREMGTSWLVDDKADIAITPVPADPAFDIKALTEQSCILIKDVIPSMPAYTAGCPNGVAQIDPASPKALVLDGVVSGTNESKEIIFTSAPTFPGNSGGPFIVYRNPFNPMGGAVIGQPTILLAGIVLSTVAIPGQKNEQSPFPPLHLGIVRAVDAVLRLLQSETAKSQAQALKKRLRP